MKVGPTVGNMVSWSLPLEKCKRDPGMCLWMPYRLSEKGLSMLLGFGIEGDSEKKNASYGYTEGDRKVLSVRKTPRKIPLKSVTLSRISSI